MQTMVRSQGEIVHLLTQDGFIQIYIQSVDTHTGQVCLGVVAPQNVRVVSLDSESQKPGNGLIRRDIFALLNLEELTW
jgi:hypothetical protein